MTLEEFDKLVQTATDELVKASAEHYAAGIVKSIEAICEK